jgi:hypothetical protein
MNVSGTELLTQEKEWNADRGHGYGEPFEEMVIWHISHSKDGLALRVSNVSCRCLLRGDQALRSLATRKAIKY